MRTTIDLPAELMRAAKTHAAARGESLKELFTRAIVHEVGAPASRASRGRMVLPLVGQGAEPHVNVTNADIEAVLSAEDAERHVA